MTDLTPKSHKIPITDTAFSSATHLNSLNFSIFTQEYHSLRNKKPIDQQNLIRKKWVKLTRNYLRIERNNILSNYFIAQKIHNSRKEILQRNFLSKWHEKYTEKIINQEPINNEEEEEISNHDQIAERDIQIENDQSNLSNTNNTTNETIPSSPTSPRPKKIIHKQYSDKSTDTFEIPKPTFTEKIKSLNCKTIILSIFIAIIACTGTYFGFHFYFKHHKYDQLYKKHKYESTLPPHDQETDGDIVVDYNKVFPEDQDGDLNHLFKSLVKKVKNIKNRQNEMNEQVKHIEESLGNEGKQIDDLKSESTPNSEKNNNSQEINDTNSSVETDSNQTVSQQNN